MIGLASEMTEDPEIPYTNLKAGELKSLLESVEDDTDIHIEGLRFHRSKWRGEKLLALEFDGVDTDFSPYHSELNVKAHCKEFEVFVHYPDGLQANNPKQIDFSPMQGDVVQFECGRMFLVGRRLIERTSAGLSNIHIFLADLGEGNIENISLEKVEKKISGDLKPPGSSGTW